MSALSLSGRDRRVVGHTGAGKTTIISLLMRFYDVQKGAIKIDGVNVKDMDLAELRRRFGVVLQDPFLFTGTIEGNIRLGTQSITDEDVQRLLSTLILPILSALLPQGFKEEVRERGSTLIDRSEATHFIRAGTGAQPEDSDLDEATSSVDRKLNLRFEMHSAAWSRPHLGSDRSSTFDGAAG